MSELNELSKPVEPAAQPTLHAIIPAGGAGSRLWPVSRRSHPKFLLDLAGTGQSMLEDTAQRLSPITSTLTVVTGKAHLPAVKKLDLAGCLAGRPVTILAEPNPADSLAAIAWASAMIQAKHGECIVGSFAADQVIGDQRRFLAAVVRAIEIAETGKIVTLGITPNQPATGYGYIEAAEAIAATDGRGKDQPWPQADAYQVRSFKEKPDAKLAAQYLEKGGYFWNAGIFIFHTAVLLDYLRQLRPEMYAHLSEIVKLTPALSDKPAYQEFLFHWGQLDRIAIDHAIAEPVAAQGGVAVVEADRIGWSDLGDYDALASLHLAGEGEFQNEDESQGKSGRDLSALVLGNSKSLAEVLDSPGAIVVHQGTEKLIVAGLPNAVVVREGDVTLVTSREKAQSVKEIARRFQDLS